MIPLWQGIPLAAVVAVAGGMAAGKLFEFVLQRFGHAGTYRAETGSERTVRLYMEKQ